MMTPDRNTEDGRETSPVEAAAIGPTNEETVKTEHVHLIAMILTEGLREIAAADLKCMLDEPMAQKFLNHYRGRGGDVLEISDLAKRLGVDEQPFIVRFYYRPDLSTIVRPGSDATRVIDLPLRPGVMESFARLMGHFPIRTSSEESPPAKADKVDQMVDPDIMRTRCDMVMKKPDGHYPLCSGLIDFWKPEQYDLQTYVDETKTLEKALIRHVGLPGPTTFYRDLSYWLIAYAGMLSGSEANLRRMLGRAERLIERFWTSNERGCLVGRRSRAEAVLKSRPNGYVPTGTWATMDEDQLEYARARQACRFAFDGGITKIEFQLDAEFLICNATVHPGSEYMEQIGVVGLGEDLPEGRARRSPPTLQPAC